MHLIPIKCLELELVESVTLGKTPRRLQVLGKVLNLLDGSDKSGINGLLLSLLLLGERLLLLAFTEEFSFLGRLGGLGLSEVSIVDRLRDRDTGDVDLGGGGNDISLAHSTKRDTVELVGTRDQKQARVELLEENNSLARESASKENKNGTGGNAGTEDSLARGLSRYLGLADILSRVVLGSLVGGDQSLLAVRLAADLLLRERRGLSFGGSGTSLLALEEASFGGNLASGETTDVGGERLRTSHLFEIGRAHV